MAWITPKTDWDADYRWDKDDVNRIQDNLLYLRELVATEGAKIYDAPTFTPFDTNKTYESMFYAREMNAIENNLEALNRATLNDNIGETKTYRPNGNTPLYDEFNRIESASLHLNKGIHGNIEAVPVLAFTLGNMRGVKV